MHSFGTMHNRYRLTPVLQQLRRVRGRGPALLPAFFWRESKENNRDARPARAIAGIPPESVEIFFLIELNVWHEVCLNKLPPFFGSSRITVIYALGSC